MSIASTEWFKGKSKGHIDIPLKYAGPSMGFPVNFPFDQSIDSEVRSHVPRLGAALTLGAVAVASRKNEPRKARELDWWSDGL